ncbi:MAG: formylmethanofuran dehydrogenase subunit A, partial [Methylophagaceae bacterium]
MLMKLTGGRIYDPENGVHNEVRDIYVKDGRIVAGSVDDKIDQEIDVRGKVIMAGAIDMHTHIGGGKINIARTMLPEDHAADVIARTELMRSGCGHAAPSTLTAGYRYAEMGYTAGFEPAILPVNARQAHMEMHDTPIIDKGGYVMLGSDDYLLRMMAANDDQESINNYV